MKKLHLSDELGLPLDAVTQTIAFLARKGAGKTYGAGKLAEEMLEAGAQVVVLDPVGVWWGLRLAADGKGKGLAIPVLGGLHGDIPLEASGGALVADLVVDRGTSVVLDVSMFRKGDRKRFATDFAEEFFHRKKGARSAVHLFVEEAQVFVPQRVQADEARMLGAFEDLVKLGRNFGIGVTLISQRPQAVNKDALSQTECLVVLQTNGAQERKALRDWIVDKGLDVGELVDALPGLKKGEAYVWSPSWLGVTKRIHIAKKKTFNASATPEVGERQAPERELVPVDLEEVRKAMAATIERAKAEDPKALRKRINELEYELAKKPAPAAEVRRVEVPVLAREDVDGIKREASEVRSALDLVAARLSAIDKRLEDASKAIVHNPATKRTAGLTTFDGKSLFSRSPSKPQAKDKAGLKKGARQMLGVLVGVHPCGITRAELGVNAVLGFQTGTFSDYLSTLRSNGFIRDDAGRLAVTDDGLRAAPGAITSSCEELVAAWSPKLKAGARRMLDGLVRVHPGAMSRADLGQASGISPSSGTFSDYLSLLRRNGLVEDVDGGVAAADALFIGGAR